MKINSINNQSFGARIKISKIAKEDIRDASILSSLGTTSSGLGVLSSLPASDPVHHVQVSAKVVDSGSAIGGSAASAGGATLMKMAHTIFKNGINKSKIPS